LLTSFSRLEQELCNCDSFYILCLYQDQWESEINYITLHYVSQHKRQSLKFHLSLMSVLLSGAQLCCTFPCLLCRHFPLMYHIVSTSLTSSTDDFLNLPLYSAAILSSDGSCLHSDSSYLLSKCRYYDNSNNVCVCVLVLIKPSAIIFNIEFNTDGFTMVLSSAPRDFRFCVT
jgi:hypothetical protein